MKKVVLFNTEDQVDLSIEQELVKGTDIQLQLFNHRDPADLAALCHDADAVMTIYTTIGTGEMEQLKNCKIIAQQAVGYNNIDLEAATAHGICVSNVPDFCLYDVALHTVALTLACARHIVSLNNQVKKGRWGYRGYEMHRLSGQVFGMIAFGNIPRTMAPMLKSFGMKLVTYDPWVSDELLTQYGVGRARSLDQLLAISDYVSVHCPLLKENINLIGKREIDLMKPTAFLLNTARGPIINEEALYDALCNKRIAGAGLDVLEQEDDGDNPLYSIDNIIITPHTAFYSEESLADVRTKAMEQILDVICNHKAPKNLINRDVVSSARFNRYC